MQTISNRQTCALSRFYDWLTCRNVRVIDSWLLLSLPAGGGSAAWWWPRPILRGLCVTGMPVSGYSLLPPPSPPTLSRIMDHKTARTRDGSLERPLIIVCNAIPSTDPVNSWWTCSDARNIGRYNSSRYDSIRYTQYLFRYDTDPIIVRSLIIKSRSLLLLFLGWNSDFLISWHGPSFATEPSVQLDLKYGTVDIQTYTSVSDSCWRHCYLGSGTIMQCEFLPL